MTDALIELETIFGDSGFEDGFRDGVRLGKLEGSVMGCKQGFECLNEVGFYLGFANQMLSVLPPDASSK